MTEKQLADYYRKFPAILQEKLKNNDICFPEGTQFDYEPLLAFRGITRDVDDNTPVNRKDMMSYFESGSIPRGIENYEKAATYYSASLFEDPNMLRQALKFPRPNKKIAEGYVHKDGGPKFQSSKGHIDWWLFEKVNFNNFSIRSDIDG